MEKTHPLHASTSPAKERVWTNCAFKFENCYVSGSSSSPVFLHCLCSVHLLLALGRESLAPACFASITICQETIKADWSPLAPRSVRVKEQPGEKRLTTLTWSQISFRDKWFPAICAAHSLDICLNVVRQRANSSKVTGTAQAWYQQITASKSHSSCNNASLKS